MKAVLEFSIPEEAEAHMDAVKGTDWRCAYQDIIEQVRRYMKYGHSFKNADEALEEIRKALAANEP